MTWKTKTHWTSVKAKVSAFKQFTTRNSRRAFVSAPKKAAQKTKTVVKKCTSYLKAKLVQLKAWWKKHLDMRIRSLALIFVLAAYLWMYVLILHASWYVWVAYYVFAVVYGMFLGAYLEWREREKKRASARETIGVDKKATKEEVRAAFRKKSKTWHPDTVGSQATIKDYKEVAEVEQRRLNDAYEVLEGAFA